MAAEIASRVEALQPNVLAGIHRHRWMRQGRHIRPKKSAPFLTVAPGRQNLQNPKSRVGTSLRQPRLPRVENGPHFLGHPVVRGAAKLPLGRRVLRTDGRHLRVLVPEAPKKKKRQRKSPKRCLVHHWCCFDLRIQTASRTTVLNFNIHLVGYLLYGFFHETPRVFNFRRAKTAPETLQGRRVAALRRDSVVASPPCP